MDAVRKRRTLKPATGRGDANGRLVRAPERDRKDWPGEATRNELKIWTIKEGGELAA